MAPISLKTKNPFGSGIELVSVKTWIGVGAFAILAGVVVAGIKIVSSKAENLNAVDSIWDKVNA